MLQFDSQGKKNELPNSKIVKQQEFLLICRRVHDSSIGKESVYNTGDPGLIPGLGRSPGEGIGYPLHYSWASLVARLVKNPPAMWKTWVWILGWEDSPGERKGYPFQYSGLQNSMNCIVHGVAKRWTRLSNFHFHFQPFHSAQAFSWPCEALTHWWGQSALPTLFWDITLPTKVYLSSQSNGFSSCHVWMWKLDYKESWALKNWCFWTVVRRRLLSIPWAARRSDQSILKEVNPEYSLEGLMLKPKLQYLATWCK